jgi:hypothetical protein
MTKRYCQNGQQSRVKQATLITTHCHNQKKDIENTSTMSRAKRHAASLVDERSGVEAYKQDPTRDPTILLYLLISFSLQTKSSQYSKLRNPGCTSTSVVSDATAKI